MANNNSKWHFEEVDNYQWIVLWRQVKFSNLMQSWGYAEVKKCQNWSPKRFLLKNKKGISCALLQVLVKELPVIGGIARINRGPVILPDVDLDASDMCNIFLEIRRLAFNRRWWYISISPEMANNSVNMKILLDTGYRFKKSHTLFGSLRLNLEQNVENLLMNMNGKWRNLLRKGQKQKTFIEKVTNIDTAIKLVEIYDKFQKLRNFRGISKDLLLGMLELKGSDVKISIYRTTAIDEISTTGFVFIATSGDTATYLVGWSNDKGRSQQSNYLLLWEAINISKKEGLIWFDLGGLTKNTPKGIAHFKKGVKGEFYENLGEFYSVPKFL